MNTAVTLDLNRRTYLPVRRPRPRGEYATTVIPSSRAAFRRPSLGSSISRQKGEYSTCRAEMGCTACARRKVSSEHSESPIYFTFPALEAEIYQPGIQGGFDDGRTYLTSSAIAPTVSSIIVNSGRLKRKYCRYIPRLALAGQVCNAFST